MSDSLVGAYLARLGITGEPAQRLLAGLAGGDGPDLALLQARLVQAAAGESGSETAGAEPAAGPLEADGAWLRAALQLAYGLPVPQPQRALMPTLLPLRRQHMTAQRLQRSFWRQLLGLFVYRPAAALRRGLARRRARPERP